MIGGAWAENVIRAADKMGFGGPIWPVHPTRAEIAGRKVVPSVEALPEAPDAAFIGVNRHAAVEAAGALARQGAGGATCFASGFAETGDGDLQAELVAAAGDMPLLGPNCYGLINYLDGALIWPDVEGGRPVAQGVAVISQSSNIAVTLTMQRRGLPLAYVVCAGNGAQTGVAEIAATLLADPRVTALGLFLEGIDDAPAFAAMAGMAEKPIVAVKLGRTETSRDAAASHTAALAGDAATSEAFLRQCGIGQVADLTEFVEALKLLHVYGRLRGRRVFTASCSGGEAGLVADLAADQALDMPPPSTAAELTETLGPLVTIANPLDYHTFIWGDRGRMQTVFAAMMRGGYDAGALLLDYPHAERCDGAAWGPAEEAWRAAAAETGLAAPIIATLPDTLTEAKSDTLVAAGIAPLAGLREGLSALAAAATPPGDADWRPLAPAHAQPGRILDEAAAKALLAEAGIPVPTGATAAAPGELAEAAAALRPPLALKGLGHAHKTEAGAVRLDLDPASLTQAADAMSAPAGYLVEEMVADSLVELLLAVRRDPVYGASLTVGAGGQLAELLADTAILVLPAEEAAISAALGSLRIAKLLDGHRGGPAADQAAVIAVAAQLASLLAARPDIFEIEINPLIVGRRGAVAADALITLVEEAPP